MWNLLSEAGNRIRCRTTVGVLEQLIAVGIESRNADVLLSWHGGDGLASTLKLAGLLSGTPPS
jgi:hypothetical protein